MQGPIPISRALWGALVVNRLHDLTLGDLERMRTVLPMLAVAKWGAA